MKQLKTIFPHALAIFGFIIISLSYFYPVLSGKEMLQQDIVQYSGMAKEQNDFRATNNTEPYWTNSAFGGMPTYQLGANYPHNYVKMLDSALRCLPRPADYVFLYFLGFYVLMLVMRASPLKAFIGALAFGLSTYLIIILGAGHNAKAHAIAYMPLVVAGVILVFRRRFVLGGLLTMVAAALEINANHFQMTYYLLILLLIITIYFSVKFIREKEFRPLLIAFAIFAVAGIFAVGANATNLMATAEYAKFSTRDKSELTFQPDGKKSETTNAMSNEYITQYSYGVGESLNLIAPRLFGGGNGEKLDQNSSTYNFLIGYGGAPAANADQLLDYFGATYWGKQPGVAAPAYIGAVVFFLAILALFYDRRKIKYAFLAGAIVSLMLSWGKNFPALTNFFIDSVPMYNKFRAVSSIQVILELCVPVLAAMGIQSFFKKQEDEIELKRRYKAFLIAFGISFGLIVLLFLSKGMFDFAGQSDNEIAQQLPGMLGLSDKYFGLNFMKALVEDRQSLYSADLLRSGFLIVLTGALIWAFLKKTWFSKNTTVILVGLILVCDLFFVDKKYINSDNFVSPSQVDIPFQDNGIDAYISQDTAKSYRVLELDRNGMTAMNARTSYFHQSLGGYHAAKPRRMQQLIDYQIDKYNEEVVNMLNTRWVIQPDSTGHNIPVFNGRANGNAWFVKQVQFVHSADEEMKVMTTLKTKTAAVINKTEFPDAVKTNRFEKDSLASISLLQYEPNDLKYVSNNSKEGLAVFSEMYYKDGWNAFIDGKKAKYVRADYVLRAMIVPAGRHQIEFKFEPQIVKTGSRIALASSVGMLFLIAGGLYFERRKQWFKTKEK